MGRFVAGDVVVALFPFSDLSIIKRRPALVLAEVEFGDLILCQITSKPYSSKTAILLGVEAFAHGGLPVRSYVRPDKLFTSEATLIERGAGCLHHNQLELILAEVRELFN